MDGYTFDEGVALLVLVKAPFGVVNYLKTTHNRNHLHSEIHKQLRMPGVQRILKENGYYREEPAAPAPLIAGNDPQSPNGEDGDTDLIITMDDVRRHENTRLEDMPNELCRTLWLKRQDAYREAQQAHLKMRNVPEGEAHNEERAKWRAEVLRLLDVVNDYWKQIDEEIARFNSQVPEPVEGPAKETPAFDVSTYRAYISKALRKKSLTPAQLAELQHRVDAMIQAGVEMKPETLEKLKGVGVSIG